MRRVSFFIWLFFGVLVLLQFSNCDGQSFDSGLYDELNSTCEDSGSCDEDNSNFLDLQFTVENPLKTNNAPSVLVAGECNDGSFLRNRIVWELLDLNGRVVKTPPSGGSEGECARARFQFYVDTVGLAQGRYRLDAEIIGLDKEGREYRNAQFGRRSLELNHAP